MRKILALMIAALVLAGPLMEVSARKGGSSRSSSRSFSSKSKSYSKPKSSSSSTWGKSKAPSAKPRSSGSTQRKSDPVATKKYQKAKENGTAFKTKSEAQTAFKQKNASKYQSKYDTKPSTRPSHIPSTTTSGGNTYNVSYNSQYGGYGYMGSGGSWMMYDAMADAAMLSVLMSSNNYHYGAAPVSMSPAAPANFWSFMGKVVIALTVLCMAGFFVFIIATSPA